MALSMAPLLSQEQPESASADSKAEKIKAVGERLIGAGVQAVITGYDDGGVDTHVFGQYDVPYLHGNAMTLCT